jgi:hypothetical protein
MKTYWGTIEMPWIVSQWSSEMKFKKGDVNDDRFFRFSESSEKVIVSDVRMLILALVARYVFSQKTFSLLIYSLQEIAIKPMWEAEYSYILPSEKQRLNC